MNYAYDLALRVLRECAQYPVDMPALLSKKYSVISYEQAVQSGIYTRDELKGTAFFSNNTFFYNEKKQPAVINSTLAGILADNLLDTPEQKAIFIRNLLAPCPAVLSVIRSHGYRIIDTASWDSWPLEDPNNPILRGLPEIPRPSYLVEKAFRLSPKAAISRLNAIHEDMEYADDSQVEFPAIPFASGWYCRSCGEKRLQPGRHCSHCGAHADFEFTVADKPWKRSSPSRDENGRFCFCAVCGEEHFKDTDRYCHRCGSPLYNPCLNEKTSGYMKRLVGLRQVKGTHYCLPDDRFCAVCGSQTTLPSTMELANKRWEFPKCLTPAMIISGKTSPVHYPEADEQACPKCGSYKRIGITSVCDDCGTVVSNLCLKDKTHICFPADRYCRTCGAKTQHQSILTPFYEDPVFLNNYTPRGNDND